MKSKASGCFMYLWVVAAAATTMIEGAASLPAGRQATRPDVWRWVLVKFEGRV